MNPSPGVYANPKEPLQEVDLNSQQTSDHRGKTREVTPMSVASSPPPSSSLSPVTEQPPPPPYTRQTSAEAKGECVCVCVPRVLFGRNHNCSISHITAGHYYDYGVLLRWRRGLSEQWLCAGLQVNSSSMRSCTFDPLYSSAQIVLAPV